MDIQAMLANHEPLILQPSQEVPGGAIIDLADLQQIWTLAHDAVHRPDEDEKGEDNPQIETGYDTMQLRMTAAHLAASIESTRIHASSGLDTEGSQFTSLASEIYAFLAQ